MMLKCSLPFCDCILNWNVLSLCPRVMFFVFFLWETIALLTIWHHFVSRSHPWHAGSFTLGEWILCYWNIWQHREGCGSWWHGLFTLHEELWGWTCSFEVRLEATRPWNENKILCSQRHHRAQPELDLLACDAGILLRQVHITSSQWFILPAMVDFELKWTVGGWGGADKIFITQSPPPSILFTGLSALEY